MTKDQYPGFFEAAQLKAQIYQQRKHRLILLDEIARKKTKMSTPSHEEIISELKSRIKHENENIADTKSDIRSSAFNQNLGAKDALESLLDWIRDE